MNSQSSNNPLNTYVLFSGAARGADAIWSNLASKYGVGRMIHYRPDGNTDVRSPYMVNRVWNDETRKYYYVPNHPWELRVCDESRLLTARQEIRSLIGLTLSNNFGANLKARNYYQVNKSGSVLAVSTLLRSPSATNKFVSGGTDLAIQLSVSLGLPTYVLDVESELWHIYNYDTNRFEPCSTPVLTEWFAGVGTRTIELFNVPCKLTGNWIPSEFVGHDKANRLIALMEQVFIQAVNS